MKEESNYFRETLKKAWTLKKENRFHDAEMLLAEALETYPDCACFQQSLADLYYRENRLKDARTLAEEVLKGKESDANALLLLGNIAMKERRYDHAIVYLKRAKEVEGNPYLLKRLITAFIKNSEYTLANCEIARCLKKFSDRADFYRLKGLVAENQNKHEKAIELYERSLKEDPDNHYLWREVIRLKTRDQTPEEIVAFWRPRFAEPHVAKNPLLLTFFAGQLKKTEAYDEALAMFQQAAHLLPADLYIQRQLGFLYAKSGQYEKTIEHLKPLLLEDPTNFYVRSSLLAALRKENRWDELSALLRELQQRYPQLQWVVEALHALRGDEERVECAVS